MRIAQVSPVAEAVPPKLYGGTERVISWLTEELVRLGHEVTLFASGDSRTSAKLVTITETATRLDKSCSEPSFYFPLLVDTVLKKVHEFDIIHGHVDGLLFPYLRCHPGIASVHTLHGRLDLPECRRLYSYFNDIPLISISDNQRQPVPNANWQETVYHGMPRDSFIPNYNPSDYFVFLGRISPEKGPQHAIEIANRAGVRLVIAAKVDKKDLEFFDQVVKPKLNSSKNIEFIGEVSEADKPALLANARALLFPIEWPEPFGLVMIEALACGTPVIAYRSGSVPEIIEHGVTGFYCDSMDQAVTAIDRLNLIDRRDCRNSFEQRFTAEKMAKSYLDVYQQLIRTNQHKRVIQYPVSPLNRLLA